MAHLQIVGQTMSGKSLLCKSLSRTVTEQGRPVLVFDPLSPVSGSNVGGWCGYVLNDFDRFEAAFWASTGCFVVIDEAADVFREHRRQAIPMLTRGRHVQVGGGGGHVVALIAQRHLILERTARDQCGTLYAFNVGAKDSAELAEDWGEDELRGCHLLPQFHYIRKVRLQPPTRGVIHPPGK